jgi:asparagine synthase (glutamine-hydrolysing)
MCGICGFYGFEDRALLKRMTDSLTHRGPDDSGYFVDRDVSLGHRRLSIIDLKTGKQPMFNEDRSVCVIFNGEIYNFQEIREGLRKHKFATSSDTETIIHAYEEYGHECLKHFRGMFAFALWDSRKKELFLARDNIGEKPLYYAFDGQKFVFGSEVKALLEYGSRREINHKALDDYLTFGFVRGEDTMFSGVRKLLPGHYMIIDKDGPRISRYWDFDIHDSGRSLDAVVNGFRKLFEESVRMRMISDVPLGAYLSGGIDSSAVVAYMSKLAGEVKTFSVGFGRENDEVKYARMVSEKFGTDHTEKIVEYSNIPALIEKLVWHCDDPMSDAAVLPTYIISQVASRKVKVVLTGEGADELFGGYTRYKYFSGKYRLLPRQLRSKAYLYQMTLFRDGEKKELMGKTNKTNVSVRDLDDAADFELRNSIPDQLLVKVDRATMASSIEPRVPFLDRDLIEFSAGINHSFKLNGQEGKYVVKKALKGMLPDEIINRKKHGFSVPLAGWFQGDLRDYAAQTLLDSGVNKKLGFNEEYVKKILPGDNGFRRPGDAFRVWRLLVLDVWWKRFMEHT